MTKEFESVTGPIIEGAPERVSEQIIGAKQEEAEKEAQNQPTGGFDPSIHRVDKNGEPVKKKDGSFALKPGSGSPKAKQKKSTLGDPGGPAPAAVVESGPSPTASQLGTFATETFFTLNMQLFGKAAIPTDETKLALTHASSLYMESKGFDKDISPGVLVIMVMSGYYAQVLQHQEPRSKVKRAAGWFARRFRKNGARIDSGANGKREDDSK